MSLKPRRAGAETIAGPDRHHLIGAERLAGSAVEASEHRVSEQASLRILKLAHAAAFAPGRSVRTIQRLPLPHAFARHAEVGGDLRERDARLLQLIQQPLEGADTIPVVEERERRCCCAVIVVNLLHVHVTRENTCDPPAPGHTKKGLEAYEASRPCRIRVDVYRGWFMRCVCTRAEYDAGRAAAQYQTTHPHLRLAHQHRPLVVDKWQAPSQADLTRSTYTGFFARLPSTFGRLANHGLHGADAAAMIAATFSGAKNCDGEIVPAFICAKPSIAV